MDCHPCMHRNIIGFINNSKKQCGNEISIFVKTINDNYKIFHGPNYILMWKNNHGKEATPLEQVNI